MEDDAEDLIAIPFLDGPSASKLLEKLYHLKASDVKKLNSFMDQNFLVTLDTSLVLTSGERHGKWDQVVIKIYNSYDSTEGGKIPEIVNVMTYLWGKGFCCPLPVTNVHGTQTHLEKICREEDGRHGLFMIVALTYIPGKLLSSLQPVPQQVFRDTGKQLAIMHKLLKDFQDSDLSAACHTDNEWSLLSLPKHRNLVMLIDDPEVKANAAKVFDLFEENVVPAIPSFRRGIIHGDYNGDNVIVHQQQNLSHGVDAASDSHDHFSVSGIIDFGELEVNFLIADIAIAMAEMMITDVEDTIAAAGLVLAGYEAESDIPDAEREKLYYLVLGRLAQVVVLCLNAKQEDPSNDYIMEPVPDCCMQLKKLLSISKSDVDSLWNI